MSVGSMDRVAVCCSQLHNHSGPYYDKWLRNYTKWVEERSSKCNEICKMDSRWLAGMKVFIRDFKRKHDNT